MVLHRMAIVGCAMVLVHGCTAGTLSQRTDDPAGGGADAGANPGADAAPAVPGADDAGGDAIEVGSLDVAWIHGSANCGANADPPLQVHRYNARVAILRQNKCVNYEAPFLYLILGDDKALLLDTGATASAAQFPVQQQIEALIAEHLGARPRADYELIVAHSHGHGDHTAGDGQFAGAPGTRVVPATIDALTAAFGIATWPASEGAIDLGNRALTIVPIPGHQGADIAVHDHASGLLLTGDTVYPGRLYVRDWNAYRASIARLDAYIAIARPDTTVAHVLGAHVEMTATPGQDYPTGTTYQPDEHVLQLAPAHVAELAAALDAAGATPERIVRDSFIVTPL